MIRKVTVIGAGTMGRQIALNCAICGIETVLNDSFPKALEDVAGWSEQYLQSRLDKGKMTQEQIDAAKAAFHLEGDLEKAAADTDLVIEAIIEDLDIKLELFKKLDAICPEKTILASNSSTYMPSQLMEGAPGRPEKYLNLHYFNPALHMKLLEIIPCSKTSEETLEACRDFAQRTNKVSIVVQKEIEGYIVNNLLGGINSVAWFLLENGYASVEDIDKGATLGLGHPMGPFRLMDASGLDTILSVRKARHEANPEKHPAPNEILTGMVERGDLGVKSGKGFYEYPKK